MAVAVGRGGARQGVGVAGFHRGEDGDPAGPARGGHRGFRGGVAVFRWGIPGGDPRQHGLHRRQGGEHRASLHDVFLEYAQSRGFVVDAARVATPTDKPRVERTVPYVRNNFFAGETFVDLADVRRRAEAWCTETAGMRVHGTTQCRPIEEFRAEELALLGCLPGAPFDTPRWS